MRAASMTAVSPERQTLLIVALCTSHPMPAATAAWRAAFWPVPACSTCPTSTASTVSAGMPPRSSAPRMAAAPNCTAVSGAS
ncbi:hypothetical protein QE416_002917 [Microbacterium sp. SORGH_AS 421]|nr:hypothetical protein [Microbacterium sp. SORGH_AS_0421]